MAQVKVTIDPTHIDSLIGTPRRGLIEAINNSFDADASNVRVELSRTATNGIDCIKITDDGTGITQEQATPGFSQISGSWKANESHTKRLQRILLGNNGKGRFNTYALGNRLAWRSVVANGDAFYATCISSHRSTHDYFNVEFEGLCEGPAGTVLTIHEVTEKAARYLDSSAAPQNLLLDTAAYLMRYGHVHLTYDGQTVSPNGLSEQEQTYLIPIPDTDESAELHLIEWKQDFKKILYLCPASGVSTESMPAGIQAPGFSFAAYLTWEGFSEEDAAEARLGSEPGSTLIHLAQDQLRDHFKGRADQLAEQILPAWRAEGVYPYEDQPKTKVDQSTRQVFDIVSVVAASVINEGDSKSRRLSLALIREALESRPQALQVVLDRVLGLPTEDVEELAELLNRTELSAIIKSQTAISDRLRFLSGLQHLVFDPDAKKDLLERRHLHRILAKEAWVFKEDYALIGDDDRLAKVLAKFKEKLGEDIEFTSDPMPTKPDGTGIIPDLVLSGQRSPSQGHLHNLVIELKRPSVEIRLQEWRQIEDYARAVTADERFSQPNVKWDFWIVGTKIDPEVMRTLNRSTQSMHLDGDVAEVRPVTWAEVITEADHRMRFFQDQLNTEASSTESGLAYLREKYAAYLPPSLATPQGT